MIARLSELQKGDFLTLSPTSHKVWIRGHYDRFSKMYSLIDFNDSNHQIFRKGTCLVFTEFDFDF